MRSRLGLFLGLSVATIGPATAQDAKALLDAADKAMGANAVNSVQFTGTGTMGFVGQAFTPMGDWPRVDMKSYSETIDYGSKSSKEEYTLVQGNNPPRGGGLGFPIATEQRAAHSVAGDFAWTTNAQGQPNAQAAQAEYRQFMIALSPHGFIKAAQQAGNNLTLTERHYARGDRTMKVIGFTTMGKYRVTGEFGNGTTCLTALSPGFPIR